ncbi:MAG: M28 family peptidase [Planctomycetes bacterium]|nr:M28 family peptidase [Planctomycetota bacterium]
METIDKRDLEQIVRKLASNEMAGRDNDTFECEEAAKFVAESFKKIGLEPAFTGSYFQRFSGRGFKGDAIIGSNVGGLINGNDEKLKSEYIVIAAHHDHLGKYYGKVMNGADDNASGVSGIIELAEAFYSIKSLLKRSLLFVSFDAEEDGMVGSHEFIKSGAYKTKNISTMICFDLIGGSMFKCVKDYVFALGAEHSDVLESLIDKSASIQGLNVTKIGIYSIGSRSDYSPFKDRKVPFVFISTSTPWYYHTEHDDPERLDYVKMEKIARFAFKLIFAAQSLEQKPLYINNPKVSVRDSAQLLKLCEKLLENKEEFEWTDEDTVFIKKQIEKFSNDENQNDFKMKQIVQETLIHMVLLALRVKDKK